jgi:putative transposase
MGKLGNLFRISSTYSYNDNTMSEKRKTMESGGCYFMTCTIVGWVDVFSRQRYRQIVVDSLKYCQAHKGLKIYGFVIMTNHIHLLALAEDEKRMGAIMRDFKRFTATNILKSIQEEPESRQSWLLHMFKYHGHLAANREIYQVWQDGFHPTLIYSDKVFLQKLNYLHQNPVRAGFVDREQDWKYSSASNYLNDKGLIDIDIWQADPNHLAPDLLCFQR